MKIDILYFWNSKEYKRVVFLTGKKSVTFKSCQNNWGFDLFGSKLTLGDTFFSKASPLKITIIFENLYFFTQRWRFLWKYLPLGLHMRFFEFLLGQVFLQLLLQKKGLFVAGCKLGRAIYELPLLFRGLFVDWSNILESLFE